MRISGIASGFDTDEMVKQLMQVERMKVDRVEQNKQTILWRQEQYNSVNKKFANFLLNTQKDLGLKKSSSTGALFGNSYKNVDYVKKAESSDESVATVTSTGNSQNGRFDLHVESMPKNAAFTSAEIDKFDFKGIKYMEFKINGTVIEVGEEKGSKDINMKDVVNAINSVDRRTTGGLQMKTETIDGKKIDMVLHEGGWEPITDVEKKEIQNNSSKISAFYDEGTGRMFLESSKGKENVNRDFELNVSGTGKFGHGFVRALRGDDKPEGQKAIQTTGNKGKVTINGLEVDASDGIVKFNGLNIEIKAESTKAITINVNTNVDGIIEKVEKFVEDYNKLIDEVAGLTNEKVYKDYKPLSPEERKALSEEDLKMWDEKAKSGLLNRDETLNRTLQAMRSSLYEKVEGLGGSFNHITQIGISTEKYAMGSAGGKLQIDMDKLRDAIEKDADGVMDLLFVDNEESKGAITKIYDGLMDGMKSIIDKSGPGSDETLYRNIKSNMLIDFRTKKGSISDLDKSINEMNREIANLNILLDKKEESHFAKFTAMEKAMHKMNGQSNWLMQQFQY